MAKDFLTLMSTIFFAISLLKLTGAKVCSTASTLKFTSNEEAECIICPQNCEVCYVNSQNNIICSFCDTGYYLGIDGECKSCIDNCASCIGPSLKECEKLKEGYFYHINEPHIKKCKDDNCAVCHKEDECSYCKEGYYSKVLKQNDEGIDIVECVFCDKKNCLYCGEKEDQVEGNSFITCKLCKNTFSLVSGECKPCPENCETCLDETRECVACQNGFMINEEMNKCEPSPIPDCYVMDSNQCGVCDTHYFLKEGQCKLCSSELAYCNYCSISDKEFKCLSCQTGYRLTKDGTCKKCPENCDHCSQNKCTVCIKGYFYNEDAENCAECKIKNCKRCETSYICQECNTGYYFNKEKKTCEK